MAVPERNRELSWPRCFGRAEPRQGTPSQSLPLRRADYAAWNGGVVRTDRLPEPGRLGGWLLALGLLINPVSAATITLNVNPSSTLGLTFSIPEVMRSGTVTVPVTGSLTEDLTFGVQSGFGTVATAGKLSGGTLNLGNASNVGVDLELLGQVTFSSASLRLTSNGPTNPFTSPPLAAGKTRIPLAGASLLLNGGTISTVATGLVGGQLGSPTFNFTNAPLTFNFPADAYMDVTVSGNTVTQSIPLNLSAAYQTTPLNFSLGLSGTLNLTGTLPTVTSTPVAVASLENKSAYLRSSSGGWGVFADSTDGLLTPFDVAFDANNNLYVTDILKSRVTRFNSSGVGTVFADAADGAIFPTSLAIAPNGTVFVTNYLTNTIARVSAAGVGVPFADAADGLNSPFGAALDASGNLYVANLGSRQILKFDSAGVATVFADAADGIFTPLDVALDSAGNVYVADALLSKVFRFTPAGVGSVFADLADGLSTPSGLAFDNQGNLLVTNYLFNKIVAISPAGIGSLYADTPVGFRSPFGIAARPTTPALTGATVPEPTALGLLLAGWAGLVLAAARRQRRAAT